ncbi:S-layer homology domain-containing protein [Paenibacillus eucommiae]|uniref:SLH domain-containing protein n=1 Tax=Paenibacillus eucommiae TaxID=1355755 RepID=A0ABS4J5L1_9BACL|nr:S-layer homology domain-containing protein [Paenibacillus eucommiae]MBP1994546.1 hypothetical protein [Paenibacillus eucommiae]
MRKAGWMQKVLTVAAAMLLIVTVAKMPQGEANANAYAYAYANVKFNANANAVAMGQIIKSDMEKSTAAEPENVLDKAVETASAWAQEDVKSAILQGLTTNSVLGSFQQPITRQHFAGIVVKLMEALTGEKAEPITVNPFIDTDDPDVLKAYALSVVRGVNDDKFDPQAKVSRQEISVMLYRVFHLTGKFPQGASQTVVFSDEGKIASWAADAVSYIASAGIVQGKGNGIFDPLGSATREEAIVLIKRCYTAAAE